MLTKLSLLCALVMARAPVATRRRILQLLSKRRSPSQLAWERGYEQGDWEYLSNQAEAPRYGVLAAYIRQHAITPVAILDLGCGTGQLLHHLDGRFIASYQGIDLAGNAIERAKAMWPDRSFQMAALDDFRPGTDYDCIVFNEVLYYAADPLRTICRYRTYLKEGGVLLVSMYRQPVQVLIWKDLELAMRFLAGARVTSNNRHVWDIHVLRPTDPTSLLTIATTDNRP